MTNKEKRKLRKEKGLRKRVEKIKRKEYNMEYLKKKDAVREIPHSYPLLKLVLVRDFFRSRDLYKAIGIFLGSQISIFLLLLGTSYPAYTPIIGTMSVLVGIICILTSIREINRRQSIDITRKSVDYKLVFKTLIIAFISTTILTTLYTNSSSQGIVQPNQQAINETLKTYPLQMIFTTIIVAPIVEEVVFRELLPFATGPSYMSFILTSILFVVVHSPSGIIGWLNYGIVAIGLLSVRLINNNVYSGVALHFLWNLLSLFF